MAHLAKFTKPSLGHMFDHYEHKKQRDNIDQTKTHLNYNLAKDLQPWDPMTFIEARTVWVKILKRKDVNYMADWVVTLPQDVRPGDQDKFFKACFDFLNKRYGSQNCIAAWVHMDETTPHLHYSYMPIVVNTGKDSADYPERLSAKDVNNRRDLKTFHNDLNRAISKALGYEVSIINEATKEGNLTTTQLKQRTELQKQKQYIDQTQKILAECNTRTSKAIQELKGIVDQVQGYKALKATLEGKIEDLQNIHQETMEQITDLASKSGLYQDLLQRNILSGNYNDVEDLQNAIYDAQEAQEVLDYMNQGIDIYHNDPSL